MRIVFMGTGDFGLPALEKLRLAGNQIVGIVSTPSKPQGRGLKLIDSAVVRYAKSAYVEPVLLPEKLRDAAFISSMKLINADLFLVAAYRILPPEVFTIPRYGTINIHASLLPRYRGPAPIQRAIEAGETQTGVTIFKIDEGIDSGGIICQKKADISAQDTTPTLYARLSELGADAVMEAVSLLDSGKVEYGVQDTSQISKAPKLVKEEGHIQWQHSNTAIYNKIRAFKPFPGTYTFLNGTRVNIEWAQPQESNRNGQPGTIVELQNGWFDIQCGRGVLRVLEVKPEGRKSMDAASFMRGTKLTPGMKFE